MGIDIEAIKRKMEKLNSVKNSKVQFWKPKEGEYLIRVVPWSDTPSDDPFKHLDFYYIDEKLPSILTPSQFGKVDPVAELAKKLWAAGTDEDKKSAKKLRPVTRHYAAIIDRANEDAGPFLWPFGKTVYLRLLGFFGDEDILDYIDVKDGLDLKVKIQKTPGKLYPEMVVDAARKRSPLSKNPELTKKWIESAPSPLDAYTEKTTEEIEGILTRWLNDDLDDTSLGTSKGEGAQSMNDAIASIKQQSADKKSSKSKSSKKKVEEEDDDVLESSSVSSDVDEVFERVLNEG